MISAFWVNNVELHFDMALSDNIFVSSNKTEKFTSN
jgi:hypothetical protein